MTRRRGAEYVLEEIDEKLDGLTDGTAAVQFVDESGVAYGIRHISNKPRVSSMPYVYDIAEGNVPGHSVVRRCGANENVAVAYETVYSVSDLKTYLTAAEQLQIASDDADDDGAPAGNGARTVTITGLDGNYAPLSETITMNGAANVTTTNSFLRVFTLQVATAGTTGYNEGTITASNNADTIVLAQIEPQENRSCGAYYTVPAGFTFYMTQLVATESSSKGSLLSVWSRTEGGLWTLGRKLSLFDTAIVVPISMPPSYAEKTDIEIRAYAIQAGSIVTAAFGGWIET